MKNDQQPSGLKDAVVPKYISHFRGEMKNSIFLDCGPNRENKIIYPAANTIAFNTLSAAFQN